MSGHRQRRLEDLFEEALQLSTHEREAFVADAVAGDDELGAMLQGLLAAHFDDMPFLRRESLARDNGQESGGDLGASGPGLVELPGPGDRLAHYTIVEKIGEGGMGAIFLARDHKLQRDVAIKFMASSSPASSQRFRLEALATARCKHENIVEIHDMGDHDGCPYLVLEYVPGTTLREELRASGRLASRRVLDIAIPVVKALVLAHDLDIVHRDLKPDNVMLTDSGGVKVMDFGVAKNLSQSLLTTAPGGAQPGPPSHTRTGFMVGTAAYMSPEQWGVGSVDHRSDMWALGIMLYEMLAGRPPIEPSSLQHLCAMVANPDMAMPSARDIDHGDDESSADGDEGVPARLAEVIDRCLKKRKNERFAHARDLLRALEDARDDSRPDQRTQLGHAETVRAIQVVDGDILEFARVTSAPRDDRWQHLHERPVESPFKSECAAWLRLLDGSEDAPLPLDVVLVNTAREPVLLTSLGVEIVRVHWTFAGTGRDLVQPPARTPGASKIIAADRYAFDSYSFLTALAPYRKQALARLRTALGAARRPDDPTTLDQALAAYRAQTMAIGETCWHELADPIYQEARAPYRYELVIDEVQAFMPANMVIRLWVKTQRGVAHSAPVEVLMPSPASRG